MNILIVDDHPIVIQGYISALSFRSNFKDLIIESALSCEQAFEYLSKKKLKKNEYDIAIIDLDVTKCEVPYIPSGKELALLIKQLMPNTKIVIITWHTEMLVIYDVWKLVQPDGFVIKNDLTPNSILEVVNKVLQGSIHKSEMVDHCIREIWKKGLMVEDYNRQILHYLNLGFRTGELYTMMQISQSAIQKRIGKMNEAFGVTDKEGLLKEVKRLGYL